MCAFIIVCAHIRLLINYGGVMVIRRSINKINIRYRCLEFLGFIVLLTLIESTLSSLASAKSTPNIRETG